MRPGHNEERTGARQETCKGGGDWEETCQGAHVPDETKIGSEQKRGGAIAKFSGLLNPLANIFVPAACLKHDEEQGRTNNNPPSTDVMGHQKDEEEKGRTEKNHQGITPVSNDTTGSQERNGRKPQEAQISECP